MDIRKGNGSSVLYNIKGDDIREGNGSSVTCNIRGKKICKGNGSSALFNSTGRLNNEELAAVLYAVGEIRA